MTAQREKAESAKDLAEKSSSRKNGSTGEARRAGGRRYSGTFRGVGPLQAWSRWLAVAFGGLGVILGVVAALWLPVLWWAAGLVLALALLTLYTDLRADRVGVEMVRRLVAARPEAVALSVGGSEILVVAGPMLVVGVVRRPSRTVRVVGESVVIDGVGAVPAAGLGALRLAEAAAKLAEEACGRRGINALGVELYPGADLEPTLVQTRRGVVALAATANLADVAAGADEVLEPGEAVGVLELIAERGLRVEKPGTKPRSGGRKKRVAKKRR